jgi:uncharacterized Tic20 family protein
MVRVNESMTESGNVSEMKSRDGRMRIRADERPPVFICHLASVVPLWALVANAVLYFIYHESSRIVCFHARQSMHFHILLMIVSVPLFLVDAAEKVLRLVRVPQDWLGEPSMVSKTLLFGVFGMYCTVCLVGAIQALRGRIFIYPIVGRKLYENYVLFG